MDRLEETTKNLAALMTDPYAVQIADYFPDPIDDLPPCFCKDKGPCKGDCPYCRIGGFAFHKMGEEW